VMSRLGGVYVDFERNLAVGADGLKVESFRRQGNTISLKLVGQLAELPAPYDQPYRVQLRIVGLPAGEYDLVLNDQTPRRMDAEQLKHETIFVSADGKVGERQ
ncbi:MAG: hypothetical protein K8T25_24290, partial [Planctomycetia bacterium]|nr:hypothetical protein [Planctomycetia bacterium]